MRHGVVAAAVLVVLVAGLPRLTAAEEKKPVVAVFDIEDKGAGLASKSLSDLSDFLISSLAATGAYQVVPRTQLKQRLTQQKIESYKNCYDQTCQIEIGKELAAQKSLSTSLMKLGGRCTITTVIYDLKRSASEGGASAEGPCTDDGILASIKVVIAKLVPPKEGGAKAPVLRGGLLVKSEPSGAEVRLDGILQKGVTPLTLADVSAEDHLVELRKGRARYAAMVRVVPEQFTTLQGVLSQSTIRLSVVTSPPEAKIVLDGKTLGSSPQILTTLKAGKHVVELHKDGYLSARRTVSLEGDAGPQLLSVELQLAGILEARSTPPGATVLVDGAAQGYTPARLFVPPGRRQVTLRMAGRVPVTRELLAQAGEVRAIEASLQLTSDEERRQAEIAERISRRRSKTRWAYASLATGLGLTVGAGVLWGVGGAQGSAAHEKYMNVNAFNPQELEARYHEVEPSKTKIIAANVLGGAAAVAFGFSIYQFLTRPAPDETTPSRPANLAVGVSPAGDGAMVSVSGGY